MKAPDLGWTGLILAGLPVLACVAALAWLRLGQVGPLAVATVRMIVQLALLGVVLRWVFAHETPGVIALVGLVMLLVSSHTIGLRLGRSAWQVRVEAMLALTFAVVTVLALLLRFTLRLEPWHQTRVVIPILGMILGNSVNAVALAVERLESGLRAGRDLVERRLSLGASARQAAHPERLAAVQAGLTPIISGMMIAGIVAIPGMSTGQILAGMEVGTALRYQMMIYLAITATVVLSTLLLLEIRFRRYFTRDHQLRRDRLNPTPRRR